MRSTHRILCLVLAVLLIVSAAPLQAKADDYHMNSIALGTNFKTKDYNNWYVYKLTVPSESVITITFKDATCDIYFHTDDRCSNRCASLFNLEGPKAYIGLEKGTYYIEFSEADITLKFDLTPQKDVNRNNYCKGRSLSLKADTWAEIANTPNHSFTRWYKISVPSKKTVKVSTSPGAGYAVSMYDSKMNQIMLDQSAVAAKTHNKIPKGTYYIRVTPSQNGSIYDSQSYGFLPYIRLRWK